MQSATDTVTDFSDGVEIENAGSLATGRQADICIFDPDIEWLLDNTKRLSKGHNTPFKHWPLKGRITSTLHAGKIVFSQA